MIRVQIDCEYGDTGLEPTSVVVTPIGLGATPAEVAAALRRLLRARDYVEVEVADGEPLPVHAATVRRLAAWEV